MKDIMIDIETLGTTPGSVVLSVAAVYFDPNTGQVGSKLFLPILLGDSMAYGMRIEPSTLSWWLEQRPEILKKSFSDGLPLVDVLSQLSVFIGVGTDHKVWGNSARFDLGLLEAAYKAVGKPIPWSFRNERCYRTITSHWPVELEKDERTAHDPIADCLYQVARLRLSLKARSDKEELLVTGIELMKAWLRDDEQSEIVVCKLESLLKEYHGTSTQ